MTVREIENIVSNYNNSVFHADLKRVDSSSAHEIADIARKLGLADDYEFDDTGYHLNVEYVLRENLTESKLEKTTFEDIFKVEDKKYTKYISKLEDALGAEELYGGGILEIKNIICHMTYNIYKDGVDAEFEFQFDALVDGDFDEDEMKPHWIRFKLFNDGPAFNGYYTEYGPEVEPKDEVMMDVSCYKGNQAIIELLQEAGYEPTYNGVETLLLDNVDDPYEIDEGLKESKEEDKLETFEDKMNFLAKDEQEAIDGYDKVIAMLDKEADAFVIEQLNKIKTEEEAHKKYLEDVKDNHDLIYTEPLDLEEGASYRGLAYYEYPEGSGCHVRETPSCFVAIDRSGSTLGDSQTRSGAEAIIDSNLKVNEGAEGHRVPGMEYVIYEINDAEKKAPIVAIRKTYTEAQWYCNKPENFTRELGIEEVPEGRFKKGDDFWGPFDGEWNLVEASSAEKNAYKDGGQRFADYIQGKAIARIKDPEARDAAVALAKAGNSKVDRFVGDRKVNQAERNWEKKADKMQKAGVEEAKEGKKIEYIEMPHEVYETPEDIRRINDELDAKAKAGKLIGIRKEPKMLQLAEPEINGIWTIYLNDRGFIEKIVVF